MFSIVDETRGECENISISNNNLDPRTTPNTPQEKPKLLQLHLHVEQTISLLALVLTTRVIQSDINERF